VRLAMEQLIIHGYHTLIWETVRQYEKMINWPFLLLIRCSRRFLRPALP